ncbi:GNAT family N-acetyltransferase [Quadrisphaera granulorum]|uniref:GNAT family N-acetyltransferase n=1 Tax=Quadrisphaera granulorum TaxID=317664 RepID=UPI001B868240|nr:GNAT family N-acetyltransferase [Quadrisphaera granulorum]
MNTARAGLVLRELVEQDAGALHALLQASKAHLTRLGNFTAIAAADLAAVAAELAAQQPAPLSFAVVEGDAMVGRVDLVAVDPPRYGLGYWLAPWATGRGLATLAVLALLEYARDDLHASDVYAGVTHNNHASAAVLHRTGFDRVADMGSYSRYHRRLAPEGATMS